MENELQEEVKNLLLESVQAKVLMSADTVFLFQIKKAVNLIIEALKNGKKLIIFGNGGSAADAQHFAAEILNKFKTERQPLSAISLVTDTSILSSIANDFGYDYVFSKQVEALGKKGDIAVAITTSDVELKKGGHSANLAHGLIAAKKGGMETIGLVSNKSKKILKWLDLAIKIPSKNTPRIQEAHITVIHIICELVEKSLLKKENEKID